MKNRLWNVCCRLVSIALNLTVVYLETIAAPISWDAVGMQMFTFYTENSNLFTSGVCILVALGQLWALVTGGELPVWIKRLKFIATSCLTMTMLTVIFVLAPWYGDGWLYTLLFTSSMLYHHFLNPVIAIVSFTIFERTPPLRLCNVPLALVPSLIYGSIALWANIAHLLDGPYPFLQVYNQPAQQTEIYCAFVLISNLFYAWLVWLLGGNARRTRGRVGLAFRG